jgi:hypothetical protein
MSWQDPLWLQELDCFLFRMWQIKNVHRMKLRFNFFNFSLCTR